MPLIEGVGDEVTQFVLAVVCCLVILLAWWSTSYRQDRFAVVILERNNRRLYRLIPRGMIGRIPPQEIPTVRWRANTAAPNESAEETSEDDLVGTEASIPPTQSTAEPLTPGDIYQTDIPPPNVPTDPIEARVDDGADSPPARESGSNSSPQDVEMDRIVNAMDSETFVLRNRRLAFFKNQTEGDTDSASATNAATPAPDEKKLLADDAVEKSADADTREDKETENNVAAPLDEEKEPDPDNIRIRLKYLNDDQKMVEGSLHEPLGEFKRRHFRGELGARKLVRLIFNGQVLQREGATLASCGLFDNCVVHCLVHQPRTPNQFAQVQNQLNPTATPDNGNNTSGMNGQLGDHMHHNEGGPHEERDWDLSHILLTILASILSIAWYCHIRFSSLFGVAASIAMLGLTALYFIAVICVYYPETQHSTPATPPANAGETAETNAAE